jgi:16S rRNA (uracil1498-N3)-methyltransferase
MTVPEKAKIRLFVEAELAPSAVLTPSPAQAHYLTAVMRLEGGGRVGVFNGRDGEWAARIVAADHGRCTLRVESRLRPQAETAGPWLAFAPLKKDATDFLVIKATELGVSRLVPVFTRFTAARRVNRDRLSANAVEAAEQCGRLTVPAIAEPAALDRLVADWPPDRTLFVCDGGDRSRGLPSLLRPSAAAFPEPSSSPPGFLIGPEGGLAAGELDALAPLPFVKLASLGPRTLRAETAAVVALACWQALAGDWAEA